MEIKIASCIGFCSGVKRAVRLAESELAGNRTIYSIGPIIHNPQVVEKLSKQGLKEIKDLDGVENGLILIRSHGVGPDLISRAHSKGIRMVNATCPFVMKSQELVKALSGEGYKILIVGEASHPEVKAMVDYSGGKAEVITGIEKAGALDLRNMKVSVIAQTTLLQKKYLEIVSSLFNKGCKELRIFNTICNETVKRQEATRKLAEEAEVMLVIGGKNSANTSMLVKICQELGKEVHHIEDTKDLNLEWFINKNSVGVASGASTPDWIIKAIIGKLKNLNKATTYGARRT